MFLSASTIIVALLTFVALLFEMLQAGTDNEHISNMKLFFCSKSEDSHDGTFAS